MLAKFMLAGARGVLFSVLAAAHLGQVSVTGAAPVELLRDPLLAHGITQGYANHLSSSERDDCRLRWAAKGLTNAQWAFWEISEQLYFAHNRETPVLPRPGAFNWTTANGAKECLVENGAVRMVFDTSKEWREGGRLDMPDRDGKRPEHGNPVTTWPHFLIGQHFARDNDPMARISAEDKLRFDKYKRLRLGIDIKLNRLRKSSEWDHRADYQAPNHAIFYIAFVVMPVTASRVADSGKFYILAPAIYSEGENKHLPGSLPWLGLDQFGDGVYFSGAQPVLQAGAWVPYDIDVKQLIREGLSAATRQAHAGGKPGIYRPEDYFVAGLLIGWEVWGGFDTDVEFKHLSFTGSP